MLDSNVYKYSSRPILICHYYLYHHLAPLDGNNTQ